MFGERTLACQMACRRRCVTSGAGQFERQDVAVAGTLASQAGGRLRLSSHPDNVGCAFGVTRTCRP
jgi:hypothetical protein